MRACRPPFNKILPRLLLFSWFVGSIWGARMREKQNGIPILMKTQFYDDLGFVLRVILVSKIDEKSFDKSRDFEGIRGDTPL